MERPTQGSIANRCADWWAEAGPSQIRWKQIMICGHSVWVPPGIRIDDRMVCLCTACGIWGYAVAREFEMFPGLLPRTAYTCAACGGEARILVAVSMRGHYVLLTKWFLNTLYDGWRGRFLFVRGDQDGVIEASRRQFERLLALANRKRRKLGMA